MFSSQTKHEALQAYQMDSIAFYLASERPCRESVPLPSRSEVTWNNLTGLHVDIFFPITETILLRGVMALYILSSPYRPDPSKSKDLSIDFFVQQKSRAIQHNVHIVPTEVATASASDIIEIYREFGRFGLKHYNTS